MICSRPSSSWPQIVQMHSCLHYFALLRELHFQSSATSMADQRILKPARPPAVPAQTGEFETLNGNCHCGAVRFAIKISPPLKGYPVVSCNCSICLRNGYLLVYPYREDVTFTQGEDALKTYSFGQRRNLHKFCTGCGSSVMFDPRIELEGFDILGFNVCETTIRSMHSFRKS
jgi:hypothetical protein